MSILLPVLITLHILVCVLMVVVVLMQRPRSEGLGAAFGGGLADNVFGSQTTNVLARFTTWLAITFFVITLLLSIVTAKSASSKTAIQKQLLSAPVPQASATPEATPSVAPISAPTATPVSTPTPAAVQSTPQPAPSENLSTANDQGTSQGLGTATSTAQPVETPAATPEAPAQN
jgi:preprotein translocase subunit SecG